MAVAAENAQQLSMLRQNLNLQCYLSFQTFMKMITSHQHNVLIKSSITKLEMPGQMHKQLHMLKMHSDVISLTSMTVFQH